MRIVSLLPAATELVVALEHGHDLVGRTHECDHPASIEHVPAITFDLLPQVLSPSEIDTAVREGVATDSTIYGLDTTALAGLQPDIVLTQTTCAVCAVDGTRVERAIAGLDHAVRVVSFDPHRLADLPTEAERIGRELGDARAGLALRSHLETRLEFVRDRLADGPRPRVAVIEWPEPVFAPGHWVPDVVAAAGGTNVLGAPGERSTTTTWGAVRASRPDVLVLAFCGFDLVTTIEHAAPLIADGTLAACGAGRVIAVDGSAWLSRPGPRLADAVEGLAWILHKAHPDLRPGPGMAAELIDGVWVGAATRQPVTGTSSSTRN